MPINLVPFDNPDSGSITQKQPIDISYSAFDVSASGHFGEIQTDYIGTSIVVTVPEEFYLVSSSYYVPLYREKLKYNVWLNRVNRNFEELV